MSPMAFNLARDNSSIKYCIYGIGCNMPLISRNSTTCYVPRLTHYHYALLPAQTNACIANLSDESNTTSQQRQHLATMTRRLEWFLRLMVGKFYVVHTMDILFWNTLPTDVTTALSSFLWQVTTTTTTCLMALYPG